jgi:hypothetical protein
MVQIGNHIKSMGEDVITAHRLLKKDVPVDEYLLVTDLLLVRYKEEKIEENFDWARLQSGELKAEYLGTLKYLYINLKHLNGH